MRRLVILLYAALLLLTAAAAAEDWDEEEWVFPGRVENGVLILDEGVVALGWYTGKYTYDQKANEWIEVEDPETEALFDDAYSFSTDMFDYLDFSTVQWPSTIKYLGGESFVFYHFRELTLPATLEIMGSYAVTGDIDVLRIETTLPWEEIGEIRWDHNGMDNVIGAYEVPEGNPVYKSVDGVLFSGDGKTLLAYPNGRKATHYDVPKGVEAIADQAFCSEYLQTVSLPIGLQSVGNYAFSDCSRLQSIALPLTVTELGQGVFNGCVSLELVSLPEGLKADKETNSWYVKYYQNDSVYRGDNGDTIRSIEPAFSSQNIFAPGRLTGSEETIGIYSSSKATEKGENRTNGSIYWMSTFINDRVLLLDPFTFQIIGWADLENVELLPSETLFFWAEARPRANMRIWSIHLPYSEEDQPVWAATIPKDDCWWRMYGPFVLFEEDDTRFACPIQDADLTRVSDGTNSVYAIVYNEDVFRDIPLLSGSNGEMMETLIGGTQIKVLEEDSQGYSVTTGLASGWVAKEYVKIIPEEEKEK